VTQGVSVATTDSIDGSVVVTGRVGGSLDSLVVTGDVDAREIWVRGDQAKHVTGGFEVARVRSALAGQLSLRADTAAVANVGVTSATVALRALDRQHGEFRVEATSANGPQLAVVGAASVAGDTTVVRFDELALGVREHRLSLERPATLTVRPDGVALDSLRIRDVNAGVLTVAGTLPTTAPIALTIRADSVELGDIGELIQANVPFGGLASVSVNIAGVRSAPEITIDGSLDQPRFGDVRLDRATLGGSYVARRMQAKAELFRRDRSVLAVNASIPVELALASVPTRMLADSLRGVISQTLLKKKGGGRVAALEILLSNNAVANLIRDGKTFQLQSIMQTSKAQGMVLLNDNLIDLVKRGVVEPREAYIKAVDKLTLLGAFKSMNVPGLAEITRENAPPAAAPAEKTPAPVGAGAGR